MGCSDGVEDRLGGLMWGIALVLVGVVIMLQVLHVMPFSAWQDWWPLVVVGLGLGQTVAGRTPKKIGDGVWLMLLGGWFYVATNHIWDLTWHNSWPLALVAAGMGMVVRSIAGWFRRRGDDVREVKNDV